VSEVDPLGLIETIRGGLLDSDLTVRVAKRSSCNTFAISQENIPCDKGAKQ
jgi:hypothetical protein